MISIEIVDSAPPNDIIIDIPEEYLENGKTLLIEEYFELFVDGYHLSKPARYIKHVHQLCLLDTLVQDTKSVTSTHQLKSDIDDNRKFNSLFHEQSKQSMNTELCLELVQIILEFPCESLKNGKSVKIEETSQGGNEEVSGNFDDLFNPSKADITIDIKILSQSLQRGTAILIGKDKMSILKSDDYQKDQKHHLDNNAIAKNDHLRSKSTIVSFVLLQIF